MRCSIRTDLARKNEEALKRKSICDDQRDRTSQPPISDDNHALPPLNGHDINHTFPHALLRRFVLTGLHAMRRQEKNRCPLWVRSGHMRRNKPCRFTPNSDRESGLPHTVMSALPLKADACAANRHVCFGPIADILQVIVPCCFQIVAGQFAGLAAQARQPLRSFVSRYYFVRRATIGCQ